MNRTAKATLGPNGPHETTHQRNKAQTAANLQIIQTKTVKYPSKRAFVTTGQIFMKQAQKLVNDHQGKPAQNKNTSVNQVAATIGSLAAGDRFLPFPATSSAMAVKDHTTKINFY